MGKHFTIPAGANTKVGPALALRVMNRDGFACAYCGAAGVALNVDHVVPQTHFPAATPRATINATANLVTACADCNNTKGMQDLEGFARMLGRRGVKAAKITAMVRRVTRALRRPC